MSDNPKDPVPGESVGFQAELARRRMQFVTAFYVAIKNSRIFDAENYVARQSVSNLLSSIRAIIETDGMLVLKVVHNYLVLNDSRVKADLTTMNCYSFVFAELERTKIKNISFMIDLAEDDLRSFLYMMGAFQAETQDPFKEFAAQLERSGVRGIMIGPEAAAGADIINPNIRERSTEVYFQSISVARDVLTRARAGRAINFRHVKKVVQNMIDIAVEEDYFLMSLTAIKNHDEYTFNHCANVCVTSVGFGQKLGLPKLDLEALGIGALLHDVGKIHIPLELLNKPGRLDSDEWRLITRHPITGVKMLLKRHIATELLLSAVTITYEHHQRLDMSGYPGVSEKREQNFLSRIVQIVDCYDAMTTPRIYRKMAMKPPEAFKTMLEAGGTAFDPELLRLFITIVGLHPVGSCVKLDTGEIGLVYSINQQPQFIDRPLIKIVSDPNDKLAMTIIDLTEVDESTGRFTRNIVDCFSPSEYYEYLNDYIEIL